MAEEKLTRILQDLRNVPAIGDLPEEQLLWLAERLTEVKFEPGHVFARQGEPADAFYILLEGEGEYGRGLDTHLSGRILARPGNIGGKLPYSRLTHWTGTFRMITAGRMLLGSTALFPEMIRETPSVVERLVGIMSDRIRYITTEDQQQNKLAALGKLSAGLAHELNNPAAAAKRAALALSEAQESLRNATARLDHRDLTAEQRKCITSFERQALQHSQATTPVDSLTQSDQEDEIMSWLERHGVNDGFELAHVLAEVSLDVPWLDSLRQKIGEEVLEDALKRIVSQVLARRLTREIESSTGRISELVKAIKEYTFMDQAPIQEIDVHQGIESTLVMLSYKLKHGIITERVFDRTLPRINAYGSELNQVWTNLMDNAADAMKENGKLTIRTSRDRDCIVVEICDTGSGIPPEIQSHIFDPFFTTKKVGEGTGLGLDTVYRIVHKHHGSIRVESKPGDTRFQVRLPLKQPQ